MGEMICPKRRSRYEVINQLRDEWRARGISRIDLAEETGYHKMILGRYERGETTPSLQRLVDWCEALGFELSLKRKAE